MSGSGEDGCTILAQFFSNITFFCLVYHYDALWFLTTYLLHTFWQNMMASFVKLKCLILTEHPHSKKFLVKFQQNENHYIPTSMYDLGTKLLVNTHSDNTNWMTYQIFWNDFTAINYDIMLNFLVYCNYFNRPVLFIRPKYLYT